RTTARASRQRPGPGQDEEIPRSSRRARNAAGPAPPSSACPAAAPFAMHAGTPPAHVRVLRQGRAGGAARRGGSLLPLVLRPIWGVATRRARAKGPHRSAGTLGETELGESQQAQTDHSRIAL